MDGNAIKKILKEYLEKIETDYAIMIDGEWGCGKTYFVCNNLKEEIEKTICPSELGGEETGNNPKLEKYQPVYYSLYGTLSSEEINIGIKKQIVIHNTDDKKTTKKNKAVTVTETAVGVIADFFNVDSKRLLNFYDLKDIPRNAVLIFDDIERSKMPLIELLGVINRYAVVDKRKVVVISNELKMEKAFCDFKEKTIRFTLNYSPTQEDIFRNIINSKKEIKGDYKQFINNNLNLILEVFRKGQCKNLRTFIFVLDVFEKVYCILREHLLAGIFLKGLLIYTCVYSIEYKNHTPTDKLNWFSNFSSQYGIATIFSIFNNTNINDKDGNDNSFLNHITRYGYDCMIDMIGTKSIADYIQYGNLDETVFGEEIKREEERIIELRKTEYGKTYNKMMDWRLIGDSEINDILSNVECFLREDKYSPSEISNLYARYLILKSNNVKCKEIDITVFIEAVNRLQNNWTSITNPDGTVNLFEWHERGYPFDDQYHSLYEHIIKIEKNIQHKSKSIKSAELLNKIKENELDSLKRYTRRMDTKQWFIQNPDELWDALQNSSNVIQLYVIDELKNATDKNDYKKYELSFIEGFCKHSNFILIGKEIDFGLLKYKDLAIRFNRILQSNAKKKHTGKMQKIDTYHYNDK